MNEVEPLITCEIRIRRIIDHNGEQGFHLVMPDQYSFIEALGLLEAARWQIYSQMSRRFGEY